jgi:hypothetical protein
MHLDIPQGGNPFTFGGGGMLQAPPAGVPPQWGELKEAIPAHPQIGIQRTVAHRPPQPQAAQAAPTVQYSGMAAAIKKCGIGHTVTQSVELRWQQGVAGKKTKIAQFQDVTGALQKFKTYLFTKPGSTFCTVVHSPMKFMAITKAKNTARVDSLWIHWGPYGVARTNTSFVSIIEDMAMGNG